jgi:prefoldin subunit 5
MARVPGPVAYAPPSREQELGMLRDQADWLKDQLDAINQRMGELDQQKS